MTRLIKWLIIISSAMILTGTIMLGHSYYEIKQREFLLRYIPPKAVDSLLKWTDYYGMGDRWIEIFSLLMTESGGKRKLTSPKQCQGYMQLAPRTAQMLRDRLRDKIANTDIFSTEFNIAGGILHFRTIYDTAAQHDWLLTVELYNTGIFNYFVMRRYAPGHVKRYSIAETYYKFEFRKSLCRGWIK